jgi:S-adenosylmethionine:diacylglycerol 3-amino-3-carboxypropyl transferase
MVSFADAHKHMTDAQLRSIVDEVRTSEAAGAAALPSGAAPARIRPDAHGTVTEPGYGHGV